MIVGIGGKVGSGKDAVTKMLLLHHELNVNPYANKELVFENFENHQMWKQWTSILKIRRFAEKLKTFSADILNVPVEMLNDQRFKKSSLGAEWDYISVRELMIRIGEGMRNVVHPDVWVNALIKQYANESKWLVNDMRYPNEFNCCEVTVRVNSPKQLYIDSPSETALDNTVHTWHIENDGESLENLFNATKPVYDDIIARISKEMAA